MQGFLSIKQPILIVFLLWTAALSQQTAKARTASMEVCSCHTESSCHTNCNNNGHESSNENSQDSCITVSIIFTGQQDNARNLIYETAIDATRIDIYKVLESRHEMAAAGWIEFKVVICKRESSKVSFRFLEDADESGNWKASYCSINAKFKREVAGYHFILDDTLIYPANYLEFMRQMIDAFDRRIIIGLYGVVWNGVFLKAGMPYHQSTIQVPDGGLSAEAVLDCFVDVLLLGTAAFHEAAISHHPSLHPAHHLARDQRRGLDLARDGDHLVRDQHLSHLSFSTVALLAAVPRLVCAHPHAFVSQLPSADLRRAHLFTNPLHPPTEARGTRLALQFAPWRTQVLPLEHTFEIRVVAEDAGRDGGGVRVSLAYRPVDGPDTDADTDSPGVSRAQASRAQAERRQMGELNGDGSAGGAKCDDAETGGSWGGSTIRGDGSKPWGGWSEAGGHEATRRVGGQATGGERWFWMQWCGAGGGEQTGDYDGDDEGDGEGTGIGGPSGLNRGDGEGTGGREAGRAADEGEEGTGGRGAGRGAADAGETGRLTVVIPVRGGCGAWRVGAGISAYRAECRR